MSDQPNFMFITLGALIVAAVLTWIVARLMGQRIATHNIVLARFFTAFFAPVLTIGFGLVRAHMDAAAHPTSDLPGMALFGTMVFALIMLAATVPTTLMCLPHR